MIGQYTLQKLCEKYNINSNNLVKKNNNILTYGEYQEIDKTLNYLINELRISTLNIEKCPSILYRNVNAIKSNILFLRSSDIVFANIESCLHVLTTEPKELEKTYSYVKKNYGITAINRNTSILSVNVDLIIDVENFDLPISKNGNLAIAIGIEWGFTKLEEIQKIIQSPEFKEHPELFTSQTLVHAKLEEIQRIIHSPEFKEHQELFTSQTLARAKLEEIQRIIQSPEFKEHPELFTSETLVRAKLEEIRILLKMEYWADERFKKLLTSSIVAKANSMISKLPLLFRLAEVNNIDVFLTSSFLLLSPSQNYALIEYLKDNDLPLIVDNKLNPIFGKALGLLKKKYNIDIKELIKKYPYDESEFNKKNGGILR